MLSKIEQEQEIVTQLSSTIIGAGFTFPGKTAGYPLIFRKSMPEGLQQMYINVKNNNMHFFSRMQVSLLEVEEVILEVGLADMDLSSYRSRQDTLMTVTDNQHALSYNAQKEPIESKKKLQRFIDDIRSYLEKYGFAFGEHYYDPHHVLEEMNRLEKEGEDWSSKSGILLGGIGADFRGLIISKQCQDSDFPRKMKMVDEVIMKYGTPDWVPYYENLKQKLITL